MFRLALASVMMTIVASALDQSGQSWLLTFSERIEFDIVSRFIEVRSDAMFLLTFILQFVFRRFFQSFRAVVKSAARAGKVRKSTPQETKAHGPNKRIMMEQAVASQHTDLSDRCGHVQAVSYTIPS